MSSTNRGNLNSSYDLHEVEIEDIRIAILVLGREGTENISTILLIYVTLNQRISEYQSKFMPSRNKGYLNGSHYLRQVEIKDI